MLLYRYRTHSPCYAVLGELLIPKQLYRNSSCASTICQQPCVEAPDCSFSTDYNYFMTIICCVLRHEMKEERCLLVYSWTFTRRLSMRYTPDCVFLWLPKMNTQAKAESIFAFRGCHNSETDQHGARARDVINIYCICKLKSRAMYSVPLVRNFPTFPQFLVLDLIIKDALM